MSRQFYQYFPIILFTSVMGFAAYTMALGQLADIYGFFSVPVTFLKLVTLLLFILNASILVYRILVFPAEFKRDFHHPVKLNFFAAVSISCLLLAVLLFDWHEGLSFLVWLAGLLLQLGLTLFVLSKMLWGAPFDLKLFTPATFIPIVGNLVVPIGGMAYVGEAVNWFFLGIGLFFSLVYMVFVFYRLFFVAPLPPPLLPSIFIALAPPSVGFLAYTSIAGGLDSFAQILYGIALFFALFLCLQFFKILRRGFFLSMWAFLFPTAAFTVATFRIYTATGDAFYYYLALFLILALTVLILYLSWQTLRLARLGKLSVPDA